MPSVPGSIGGNADIAANAPCVAYSIAEVTDATGYTWIVPADAVITSGQGSTGILVDFGTTGGNRKCPCREQLWKQHIFKSEY